MHASILMASGVGAGEREVGIVQGEVGVIFTRATVQLVWWFFWVYVRNIQVIYEREGKVFREEEISFCVILTS